MKYEQRLAELGVDKTMVSKGLQKKIKDFEDLLDFVEGSKIVGAATLNSLVLEADGTMWF